jgi:probable addiction module antidote protein
MKHAGSVSHDMATIQEFKDNPQDAAAYSSAVLVDGDQEEVLFALRRITTAFGGVPKLAEQTDMNAKTLYRKLSARGNPEMKSLIAVLKAMGMRLAVELIKPRKSSWMLPGVPRSARSARRDNDAGFCPLGGTTRLGGLGGAPSGA